LCCYAGDGLRPETASALARFAPCAETVNAEGDYGYWQAISERWDGKQSLVIIEQDIVINEDVIPSFAACTQDWCAYAYDCFVYTHSGARPYVGRWFLGFGCAKFSAGFQQKFPLEDISAAPVMWPHIDMRIVGHVSSHGAEAHDHGDVQHLHDYTFAAKLFNAFGLWGGGGMS
jgi:hypothetical protein